jgi:hypothetical protein
MVVISDVAGRIDAFDSRTAILVHEDPVLGLDTAVSDDVNGGLDPHADNGEIALDAATAFGKDAFDASRSLEPRRNILEHGVDAVVSVNGGHDLADLFPEYAEQWGRRRVDADDVDASLTQ